MIPTLHDAMSQTDFSPFSHEDSIPTQLDAIRARLDEDRDIIRDRFTKGDLRMSTIEGGLRSVERAVAENTVISRESADTSRANADVLADIRDAQVVGRSIIKVARWLTRPVLWLGTLAGAGTAIYAAWYAFTHSGKMP
jgi:hypothetical protein